MRLWQGLAIATTVVGVAIHVVAKALLREDSWRYPEAEVPDMRLGLIAIVAALVLINRFVRSERARLLGNTALALAAASSLTYFLLVTSSPG
jgi:hypothetical protein